MEYEALVFAAEQDWISIQNNLAGEIQPWGVIAFNAEQAAEKYLKAFLAFKGSRYPKTHDLPSLLMLCKAYDPSLDYLKEDCQFLTEFAVTSRYPETEDEYDRSITMKAIETSKIICEAIRERL